MAEELRAGDIAQLSQTVSQLNSTVSELGTNVKLQTAAMQSMEKLYDLQLKQFQKDLDAAKETDARHETSLALLTKFMTGAEHDLKNIKNLQADRAKDEIQRAADHKEEVTKAEANKEKEEIAAKAEKEKAELALKTTFTGFDNRLKVLEKLSTQAMVLWTVATVGCGAAGAILAIVANHYWH